MISLWQATADKEKSFPPLTGNIKTDVAIIGGGIAGILTGFMLKEKGVSCVIVEKEKILSGTTLNTTAKITSQHGLIYQKLVKDLGEEKTALYYRLNQDAIEKYRNLSEKYPCDFESRDNYIYSTTDRRKIYTELEALGKIGASARLFDSVPLPLKIAGAVCFPNQAQFNPAKLLYPLSAELEIYENTFAKEVRGKTVLTDRGAITAENIVMATHFPFIDRHGLFWMKMYQDRSYVIALKAVPELDGMYLDESEKGFSFRNYGEYLLLGSGSHRTGKKSEAWKPLRDFAKAHYPHCTEEYAWAAQDCMTLDSMPYVGQYSKNTPNLYVATGFNKWGMTSAMIAAELLSDTLIGKKHIGQELFSPSRSILKPQLFLNGIESAANMLTPLPKRCSHLGCALKYNKAEHSWDCSCHGSRFTEKGDILDGPANKELEKS